MKMWAAIHTNLIMALNLLYGHDNKKNITFIHTDFVNIQTIHHKIHVSTTPTSAILSITYLDNLVRSNYTGRNVPKLETVIFTNKEESIAQTVKQILLKIKPLLDTK